MADVFISYSRKDRDFVTRLDEALQARGREAWVDRRDIRPAEEYMQAILPAIEGTDAFISVISPDSVVSEVCGRELAHAVLHNKRLIPVMTREVDAKDVPEPLAKLHWVSFCCENDSFEVGTETLISALDTDLGWVRAHTRLLTRAIEWEAKAKSNSFVLRGEDLRAAEQWLAQAGTEKERQPTTLQTEYIIASRKASSKRQRITLGAVTFGAVVAVALAILAWTQRGKALEQEKGAARNAQEANRQKEAAIETLSQSNFATGTRLTAQHQCARALAFFADAVRRNGHLPSAARIATLLTNRVWPRLMEVRRVEDATTAFFSPNGRYVLAILPNGSAEIRAADSGQALSKQITYDLGIASAHFSPNDEQVVITTNHPSTEDTRSFQLWDCRTGRAVSPVISCERFYGVAFSADSSRFALCAMDATFLWNSQGTPQLRKLEEAHVPQFSADGQRLVTVYRSDGGGSVQVWDTRTGALIGKRLSAGLENMTAAALSPDGKSVATGTGNNSQQGAVRVWDVASGRPVTSWLAQSSQVIDVVFTYDGRWILSLSQEAAQVFDAVDGKAMTPALAQPTGAQITAGAFSPEGDRIVTAGGDGSICVWDISTAQLAVEMWEEPVLESVRFSRDGRAVAAVSRRGTERRIWHVLGGFAQPEVVPSSPRKTRQETATTHGGDKKTPDGRLSIVIRPDKSVSLSDSVTGESKLELLNVPEGVQSAEFSPNGNRILLRVSNKEGEGEGDLIGLWDASTGKMISTLLPVELGFEISDAGRFSPDSQRFVLISDRLLRVLDTSKGSDITPPLPLTRHVSSVRFSPDSSLFATAGEELQIFRARDGRRHINAITPVAGRYFSTVAFSRDNRRFLASTIGGDDDGSHWQLFDTPSGQPVSDSHQSKSSRSSGSACFGADDQSILDDPEPGQKWDAPPAEPAPPWLPTLAESIANQQLNEGGVLEIKAASDTWEELRVKLTAAGGDSRWERVRNWILLPPERRTLAPFATTPVHDFVERARNSNARAVLESALRAAPEDGQLRAHMALQSLTREDKPDIGVKLRADHQSLLATMLDPASAEVRTIRAKILTALRALAEAEAAKSAPASTEPRR